jgi:hypothetical protein
MHDDFPDRLKMGCNSEEACGHLVAEASDRLNDCASYLVGNSLRSNWQRAKTMCHREFVNCEVALDKANHWVRWTNANGGKQAPYGLRWLLTGSCWRAL